jgi:xanthine dehydrogenase small subunit
MTVVVYAVKSGMEPVAPGFRFTLNGESTFVDDTPAQTTLLDFVRAQGLTGAKEGCAEGECGACAVLLVQSGPAGTTYQSVNSCLVPLPAVAGQEVFTVESLATNGGLADVQREMAERGGSQCGYCTPGFIVSMFAEHYRRADREVDPHMLGGNLCRCTGYRPIGDALRALGRPDPDCSFSRRLQNPVPALEPLDYKTATGRFSRPCSLAACFQLAAESESARFVAGNTDLGVMTNLRDVRFSHLISLEGIPELRHFINAPEFVEIGAGLTLTEIGELWQDPPAIFSEWLPLFASVLIRNRATLGGNLCTASPIGDATPMLLALDAELILASATGERTVPLHRFFLSYRETVLARGEVIKSVRIPKPFPQHARFFKLAKRAMDDISTVAAGISVDLDRSGVVRRARLAYGGVAAVPLRVQEAEQALLGSRGDEGARAAAEAIVGRVLKPLSDHRGSAAYRVAMAQSVIEKFWDGVPVSA